MTNKNSANPKVSIIMGSRSDWPTMKNVADTLDKFDVPYEARVISAHRTPKRMYEFAETAKERGVQVIVAGAAYAAHLPGMTASMTDLPVIGVPVESKSLKGMDSLLSIVQMPKGIPVATVAIGDAGAINAGMLATKMLALSDKTLAQKLKEHRETYDSSIPNSVADDMPLID